MHFSTNTCSAVQRNARLLTFPTYYTGCVRHYTLHITHYRRQRTLHYTLHWCRGYHPPLHYTRSQKNHITLQIVMPLHILTRSQNTLASQLKRSVLDRVRCPMFTPSWCRRLRRPLRSSALTALLRWWSPQRWLPLPPFGFSGENYNFHEL